MSKKQFDHIENRIREAAANSEPVYDENAWINMEARLNKEDNKKRRFLLWWILLPLLFIAAGSFYLIFNTKPSQNINAPLKNQPIADAKLSQQKNITPLTTAPISTEKHSVSKKISPISKVKNTSVVTPSSTSNKGEVSNKINFNKKNHPVGASFNLPLHHNNKAVAIDFVKEGSNNIKGIKKGKLLLKSTAGEIEGADVVEPYVDTANSIEGVSTVNKIPDNNSTVILKDGLVKKDNLQKNVASNLSVKKTVEKIKKLKSSRFYFLASLGADAGNMKFLSFKNNTITAKYGVGIGYQLSKKISLQTGFYASRKKYSAGPGDYNPKEGSYWNMVEIVKVTASCLVYDIPLTLRYNIMQKPATTYFTTVGISSFIMKKEDYNYRYYRNNVYYETPWTYTGNKNLFAVFNFSVGVEKKLSPNFSIQAEPSVSIPISGVGDGRVKLYSTALQLSIKYQRHKKL